MLMLIIIIGIQLVPSLEKEVTKTMNLLCLIVYI
jgi:hypothetical protein